MATESDVMQQPDEADDAADRDATSGANADGAATTTVNGVAGDRLLAFIERVERLNEEVAALKSDIKDVMAEAKGAGFDVRVVRALIKARRMDPEKRREFEATFSVYARAIGLQHELPF